MPATVFYDRPRADLRPSTVEELHALLAELEPVLREPLHPDDCCSALYSDELPRLKAAGALCSAYHNSNPRRFRHACSPRRLSLRQCWSGSPG